MIQTGKTMIQMIKASGRTLVDFKSIPGALNVHFGTIGDKLLMEQPPRGTTSSQEVITYPKSLGHFYTTNVLEVTKIISDLRNCTAPGLDGVNVNELKHVKEDIAELLSRYFNFRIKSGTFPDDIKSAKITPIFNKSSKQQTLPTGGLCNRARENKSSFFQFRP